MIKVVIDTNIFISSLIGNGNSSLILDLLCEKEFNLIISHALLDELSMVLLRPKFQEYFTYAEIKELTCLIQSYACIPPSSANIHICRDPKDDIVLECAIDGKADFIVTGDDDLLCLNPFRDIHILTPAQFVQLLESQ